MCVAAMVVATNSFALAETSATPATKSTTVAQTAPAPKKTPDPFTYRGYIRAYDFTRQNAYGTHSATNQQSENNAINLHADYAFSKEWSIGGSYIYANPFNGCTTANSRFPQVATNSCSAAQPVTQLNPDDTLPGFELSTLYDAYVQYKDPNLFLKGGDMVFNSPWANASDSRLKPVSFQGVDASYKLNANWSVEAANFWQWECRTCSNFDHGTLLTALGTIGTTPTSYAFTGYSGANALENNIYDPTYTTLTNNGFWYGKLGYAGPKNAPLTANLYYYDFQNIAGALWLDAKLPFAGKMKPFVALQYGSEGNTGSSLVGKISSTVFGMQAGFNVMQNVTLTGGFDTSPWHTDTVTLPFGFSCNGTVGFSSASLTAPKVVSPTGVTAAVAGYGGQVPYFLPQGGPAVCTQLTAKTATTGGTANIYYGGWATPYTDSYATDPLFTTSLTRGIADQRAAGNSYKLQATFTSNDKRFVSYVTQAWYDYSNGGYALGANETDFDALYYFSPLPKSGGYKGFTFRYRYGSRSYSTGPNNFVPAAALFKYNRFQAEYDF